MNVFAALLFLVLSLNNNNPSSSSNSAHIHGLAGFTTEMKTLQPLY